MNEQYFTIGAQVYCEDGKCGKLAKVAIDPEAWQVTGLVVEEGFLLKRARVFPTTLVAAATAEEVHLAISSDEAGRFPEYRETEIEALATHWDPSIGPDEQVLADEAAVRDVNRTSVSPELATPIVRQKVHDGLDENLVVAGKNTEIQGPGGTQGRLHCLMVNTQADQITGLMLRTGLLDNERMLVPGRLIEQFGDERIRVSATKEELEQMAIGVSDV